MATLLERVLRRLRPDSVVSRRIGRFDLLMPRSHRLPDYLASHASYGANLPRIVALAAKKYPSPTLIDVGANIGDTLALVRSQVDCRIVCIDGDPAYLDLLARNAALFDDAHVIPALVGAVETRGTGTLARRDGTSSVGAGGEDLQFTTLDALALAHPGLFGAPMVLKIDTDGFDIRVLRGARQLLARTRPILFAEYLPTHIVAIGDDPAALFEEMRAIGYAELVIYDNYGRFLLSCRADDERLLRQLRAYVDGARGAIPYFDIAAFFPHDADLADLLVADELRINGTG